MAYLTKSRFKIALDCVTQLYYHDDDRYANESLTDNFLAELARGGFQVGAIAQCYHPGGILISQTNHQHAFRETLGFLKKENVILYEAAFLYRQCFIRVDILVKKGNRIQLIEVKSKSISEEESFYKKEKIAGGWQPYLYDIAFQDWVTKKCLEAEGFSQLQVTPFLMLANKDSKATVEGLNQFFYYDRKTRKVILQHNLADKTELGEEVLIKIKVEKEVQELYKQEIEEKSFEGFIDHCSEAVKDHRILYNGVGAKCKSCSFIADAVAMAGKKLSGFHECWKIQAGLSDADFNRPMSWGIWDARRKAQWIADGKFFMDQLHSEDLGDEKAAPSGFSRVERQDIQRVKSIKQDYSPQIHRQALKEYFSAWEYPFHCIDFETTTVALPFHKNMRPYEQIAFQFSHHILHEDGRVVHHNEWISSTQGEFPNFQFVRELKRSLAGEGTIFRYAAHENTVLCQILKQLENSDESDKADLISFIETITTKKEKTEVLWHGDRSMVDLCKVVKSCYYSLYAGGSNSIKYVLPAILNSSKYLQKLYGKNIYGSSTMPSKNFSSQCWIVKDGRKIRDPYDILPPVFSRVEDALLEKMLMDHDAELTDGGAAMAAYGMMQFTIMSDDERAMLRKALLRYCELDTLAMVMILQEFRQLAN